MNGSSSHVVYAAVDAVLDTNPRLVLAVSGGVDSMTLLDAVASRASQRHVVVATFDHGTGPHATDAARFVVTEASARGLEVVSARAANVGRSEDAWRSERWKFLRQIAARERARVATAHSRDDHAETLVMRVFRGSGARGLAGLYARSDVVRPFLELTRAQLTEFARTRGIRWVEDPTNASRAFLRNRVRLDVIPALARVGSPVVEELLELAHRAAAVREALDRVAHEGIVGRDDEGRIHLSLAFLQTLDDVELRALWPSLAAMAGIRLDRRGTALLAEFTSAGMPGARVQVAGGVEVFRHGDELVVQPSRASARRPAWSSLRGPLLFGRWRFVLGKSTERGVGPEDAWWAALPANCDLRVRSWKPGDRMRYGVGGERRRVKRFLADARIPALDRDGWPVVTANGEIVWIPGVRRSPAATVRSGRSVVLYCCERFHG